jgi:hypothetical protein
MTNRIAGCHLSEKPNTFSLCDLGEKSELFSVGTLEVYAGVDALVWQEPWFRPMDYLRRHLRGDWGDVDVDIAETNDYLLRAGHGHVISSYKLPNTQRLEIYTSLKNGLTGVFLSGLPSSKR